MTASARSAPPLLEWLKKEGLPKPLLHLQHLLKKALETTHTDWQTLERVYGWVYQLAHVLGEENMRPEERQLRFLLILMHMQEQASQLDSSWQQAIAHFLKVTGSYAPHLFFCYQIPDLPKTNNGLEQSFGSVRRSEHRATGGRGAVPGLVVHGAVRVQAALATRVKIFTAQDLVPHDPQAWRPSVLRSLPVKKTAASNPVFASILPLIWPILRNVFSHAEFTVLEKKRVDQVLSDQPALTQSVQKKTS